MLRRAAQSSTPAGQLTQSLRWRSTATVVTGLNETKAATNAKAEGWDEAKPYSDVPGPKPIPVLGNIWRFFPGIGDLSKIKKVDFVKEMHARYGPIVKIEGLMKSPMIWLSDPTSIEQVFRNEGQYPKREGILESIDYYYSNFRKASSISLGTANGEDWQKFRSAVNQVVMQPRNVKIYVSPIDQVTQEFIDKIKELRDENEQLPADFQDEIAKWALESITYVALDVRLGALEPNLPPDSVPGRMVISIREVFQAMFDLDFGLSPWKYISTPAYRRMFAALDFFFEVVGKHVDATLQRLKSLSPQELENREFSVLERLIINEKNDPIYAISMALDMLMAGVDTTSNQVPVVMYMLATNPEKQKILQAELDREIPDPSVPLTGKVLDNLRYLRACIKEAIRIQPTANGLPRTTVKDLVLQGYQVPEGTCINLNFAVAGVDERFAPRASEYLPERWLPGHDDLKIKNPFAYIPFGFGPRMCAGKRFADMEMEVLIAKLFRSYNFEWHHPEPERDQRLFVLYTSPMKFTMKERA